MHAQFLFVYGTLQSKTNHPMAKLLQKHSIRKGNASIKGRLYDVGSFPAAILSKNETDQIFGELYKLKDANVVIINDLDEYEGFHLQSPKDSLFIRKEVTVQHLEHDNKRTAWVYLYNRSVDNLTHIPGGDYLEYLKSEKNQN